VKELFTPFPHLERRGISRALDYDNVTTECHLPEHNEDGLEERSCMLNMSAACEGAFMLVLWPI